MSRESRTGGQVDKGMMMMKLMMTMTTMTTTTTVMTVMKNAITNGLP